MTRCIYSVVCLWHRRQSTHNRVRRKWQVSLSDFLVPSLVARKAPNLNRVHLSRPHRRDLHSPGCISRGALTFSGCVEDRWKRGDSDRGWVSRHCCAFQDQKGLPQAVNVLYRCRGPSLDLSMTVNAVLTPSMTSSNSMSSGYCSLDDESEDFSFFTAKTSFFRKPNHAPKVQNQGSTHCDRWNCESETNSDYGISDVLGTKQPFISKTCYQKAEVCRGSGDACALVSRPVCVWECRKGLMSNLCWTIDLPALFSSLDAFRQLIYHVRG